MKKQFLEIGKIVTTHGIKGEMKLQLWCDDANFVKQFTLLYLDDKGENSVKLLSVRAVKNDALICLDGIDTIEKANSMRNQILYINRNDANLPADFNFIQDLIDCKVVDLDSKICYGIVNDVQNLGASDIYEVKQEDNKVVLIPAVKDIVKKIDTDNGVIYINAMKGLFDNEN